MAECYQWSWQAKTLKWVAYGCKDMGYFSLKILQKYGYLNSRYALAAIYDLHP